ncbi:MAG: ATP-binding protein [Spirochaetaceae bacterium]
MIERSSAVTLRKLAESFPVVAIYGPRQSGKTTLARHMFGDLPYVSLENLDIREYARSDPRGFLTQYRDGALFDEVHNAPGLLSYLQQIVDESKALGRFVLTASQQYLFQEKLSQSLAGRVGALTLLPFSFSELDAAGVAPASPDELLYKGLYPPVYDRPVPADFWYDNYVTTYLERDVRQVLAVKDLVQFQRFLRLAAGRTGQLLNLSNLGDDVGISHNTAREWISVLEAGFVLFRLPPHHASFSKRLIRTPKLYFYDPGLAAWLLGIQTADQLSLHPLRGALFETYVVAELLKAMHNRARQRSLYFWRDRSGLEIDALIDLAGSLYPVEVKAGATITEEMFRGLRRWRSLAGQRADFSYLVYGGRESQSRSDATVLPWDCPVPSVLREP